MAIRQTPQRILFIELLGGIGDVLIALSAIQAIARSHPQAKLTLFTFAAGGQLLVTDPLIQEVVYAEDYGDRRQPRSALANFLQQRQFDLIVSDTCYDGIDQLIQTAGAPWTLTNLWRSPPPDQAVGERFLEILLAAAVIDPGALAPPQLHLTPRELQQAQAALHPLNRPLIFLYPDAGMPIKRWPLQYFIQLGQLLQADLNPTLIIPVGADPLQAETLQRGLGEATRIWPQGELRPLAAAIAQADLFIAADTGTARIAAALGVPTLTLFGPSWQGRYGQPPPHLNLQGAPNCPERAIANFTRQRCWQDGVCPFDRWQTCLEDLTPAVVLAAAHRLLASPRPQKMPPQLASPPTPSDQTLAAPGPPPNLPPTWAQVRNLLVMRLDNLGDVLLTSPALRALRANLPQAQITLMTSPGGAAAIPLLPWIDQGWSWRSLWQNLGQLAFNPQREWQLVANLQARQFDAVIIFTSFSQSPHPPAYLCQLAGIPLRLGSAKETGQGVLTTELPPLPDPLHQAERNLQLLEAIGFQVGDRALEIQVPPAARQRAIQQLAAAGLSPDTPYLLLNPWTSCQARTYAWERFAIAARQLSQCTDWPVVVTGMAKDRDRSGPLLAALGSCAIDLIGQTRFAELAALIARARLLLSNNTSTMHLADASGTPSVILFAGTESESQWQPRHSPTRLLRRPTPCSPCYALSCPYGQECLEISPEQVVAAGRSLLQF